MAKLKLEVLVDNQDDNTALSLRDWLVSDVEVRRYANVAVAPSRPDQMGGAIEVIDVILTNAVGVAGLVLALDGWRKTHSRRSRVTIKHGELQIVVEDATTEDVQKLVNVLADSNDAVDDAPRY